MYLVLNMCILDEQVCTDSVEIQQIGRSQLARNRLAIFPRLNFTCNGKINNIRARVLNSSNSASLHFQIWRPLSPDLVIYNRIGEVQLQSDDQVIRGSNSFLETNITLTGDDRIEFQSGDVIGYFHPPVSHYQVRDIQTDGYYLYRFDGSPAPTSVNLNERSARINSRQPLIQFKIGELLQIQDLKV